MNEVHKGGTVKIIEIEKFLEYCDDEYWDEEIKRDNEFYVMDIGDDTIWVDKDGDEMEIPLSWVAPAISVHEHLPPGSRRG